MESQIKVTFWLNKTKKNSQNLGPVYLRVTFNYDYIIRSTGLVIKESERDNKAMGVKGISKDANIINNKLDSLKMRVHQPEFGKNNFMIFVTLITIFLFLYMII